MSETKEWTIMFYFASDNPLATGIVSQLKAIKDAGFHKEANVIAYFDPHTQNTPSHIFEVNQVNKLKSPSKSRVGRTANDPFVTNLVLDKLWGNTKEDEDIKERIRENLNKRRPSDRQIKFEPPPVPKEMFGEQEPKEALKSFLKFCKDHYKARHYMLFFLGHGQVVGNDIFLFDENTHGSGSSTTDTVRSDTATPPKNSLKQPNTQRSIPLKPAQNSLLLKDLREELKGFSDGIKDTGGKLELVGFHSCSMSGLELAFEIGDLANYMMASQGPAFVGSYPYRHMLIRLFNDLNASSFKPADLEVEPLVNRLKEKADPVCQFLFEHCFTNRAKNLLNRHDPRRPDKSLRTALADALNSFLETADLHKSGAIREIKGLEEVAAQMKGTDPQGTDLLWLNRTLLECTFRDGIKKKKERPSVRDTIIDMFDSCKNNSLDFLLAGYSFDITLCDLTRLKDNDKGIEVPLKELSSVLKEGLSPRFEGDKGDKLINALILLAHWRAQSFFGEQYTDLFDFCFCLNQSCNEVKDYIKPESDTSEKLNRIQEACQKVMTVVGHRPVQRLNGAPEPKDDSMIVRSAFIGPEFQYSHGFSIFFPWSRPTDNFFMDEYKQYQLNKLGEGVMWNDFLGEYFKQTMRASRKEEEAENKGKDSYGKSAASSGHIEIKLLELFQLMSNSISRTDDQLGPPAKQGGIDPTGDGCVCPSIKNYPTFTDVPLSEEYGSKARSKVTQAAEPNPQA